MREHDIFVQITEDVCLNFSLRGVGVWQKMSPRGDQAWIMQGLVMGPFEILGSGVE